MLEVVATNKEEAGAEPAANRGVTSRAATENGATAAVDAASEGEVDESGDRAAEAVGAARLLRTRNVGVERELGAGKAA